MPHHLTFDDFLKADIRVGRIVAVLDFPEARKPAYKLTTDFDPDIGQRSAIRDVLPRNEWNTGFRRLERIVTDTNSGTTSSDTPDFPTARSS